MRTHPYLLCSRHQRPWCQPLRVPKSPTLCQSEAPVPSKRLNESSQFWLSGYPRHIPELYLKGILMWTSIQSDQNLRGQRVIYSRRCALPTSGGQTGEWALGQESLMGPSYYFQVVYIIVIVIHNFINQLDDVVATNSSLAIFRRSVQQSIKRSNEIIR